MRYFLSGALLWLSLLAAHAQEYYFDLRREQLPVADRACWVEQVLDGRAGHPPIGVVYRGMGNKPAALLFRRGLAAELTDFVHSRLPARSTDHPVVLCVRQLQVHEEEMGRLKASAHADLALDVYAHLPDGYHFVQSAAAHTSARTLKTNDIRAAHVALLLNRCLSQLAQADWLAAARQPALALTQLPTDAPADLASERQRAQAILKEAPRRGIYQSFEQFLANRPDTSVAFRVDTVVRRYHGALVQQAWLGVAHLRPLVAGATGRAAGLPDIWGFCDGHRLFVQHLQNFFPLLRQGNFFTFVGEAPADLVYARAVAEAQKVAQFTMVTVISTPDRTAEPKAYALDMRTGTPAPYPGLQKPVRVDSAIIYVYRPARAIGPPQVTVLANGQSMGTLRPGEYLQIVWTQPDQLLQLWLEGWPGKYPSQYLVPNTARYNYLKLDAAPTPSYQWVSSRQGEADLNALDQLQK